MSNKALKKVKRQKDLLKLNNSVNSTGKCIKETGECWEDIQPYCEYFIVDNSDTDEVVDIDTIMQQIQITALKQTTSAVLDCNMTELWQHYLHNHIGQYTYAQCKLDNLCLFVQRQQKMQNYYCRKQSWNLSQTMHVYFFHTKEYIEARLSSSRKHRYVRDRTSYRTRTHNNAFLCTNIQQSNTPLANDEIDIMSHSVAEDTIYAKEDNINDNNDNDVEAHVTQDYYAIRYQSTMNCASLRTLEFGTPFVIKSNEAKHKNPRDEVLNNGFAKIDIQEWNDLIVACKQYSRDRKTKQIGLTYKEVIGLKLYTDFDELQCEYRKCYRANKADYKLRQRSFYHWNYLLLCASGKSRDIIVERLYHGVNSTFCTPSYSGTYYGPISTTSVYEIAQQFAGKQGSIFELYPTFARRGLKVSWLSNFPDEDEVLYMNTSFQIANVYHYDITPKDIHLMNDKDAFIILQKSILKALHVLNTESNVISFSDMQDLLKEHDLAFHQLDEHEQISILYLLYLQYSKDWDTFWEKQQKYKRIAFAKYRDQFIVLAQNVIAVKMERLPMLLQHFFYTSHKKYKFPFNGSELRDIKQQFRKNQSLRFETIIRLFPNTQQLLINGNNFDWSLERLIKFMTKYEINQVKLQEIKIKFIAQYPAFNAKYDSDEEEAAKRLKLHKAHKNLCKLKKLGWIFSSACHLRRVGFEPLPELPFLVVFIAHSSDGKQEIFYRTYSRKILNRSLVDTMIGADHHSTQTSDTFSVASAFGRYSGSMSKGKKARSLRSQFQIPSMQNIQIDGIEPLDEYKQRQPGNYASNMRTTIAKKDTMLSVFETPCFTPGPDQVMKQSSLSSSFATTCTYYSGTNILSTSLSRSGCEGQNPLILNYNPCNCMLSQDMIDILDYKQDLIEFVHWRLDNHNVKKPKEEIKQRFIKYSRKVQILVIDPMCSELFDVFMEKPNNKKAIVSFSNIYKLFANVTDVFLRDTQLNLRIGYKFKAFVQHNKYTKLERIFFNKTTRNRIKEVNIKPLREVLKSIKFGFIEREQMIVRNTS